MYTLPTLHAELSNDQRSLVLIAEGQDPEIELAAARLAQLTPAIRKSDPPGALTLGASWPAVVQLSGMFGPAWRPGPALTEWMRAEMLARVSALDIPLKYGPPDGLVPRDYQIANAQEYAVTGHLLCCDEQGTGKCVTTVIALCERAERGHIVTPIVVVCPASVVDPWLDHFRDWAPHWKAVAWRGPADKRRRLAKRADVYVVSYDTARSDAQEPKRGAAGNSSLLKLGANSVVLDEIHKIGNEDTAQSHCARRIARTARDFIGLSGTPIRHDPLDLWPALNAMEPVAWPSRERYGNRYIAQVLTDYNSVVLGLRPETEPEFRNCLLGRMRRVAKADVLDQLPPKVYSVRTVELPAEWRAAYDDMATQMLAELPEDGGELGVMSVLAQLTRLSQLACAPADVAVTQETQPDGTVRDHYEVTLRAPSWKVDALMEVLDERPGQSTVVFAPSRQLVMLAGEAATAAGYRVGYIVGGQLKGRTETITRFQAGELDVICATTGAGGVGVTLTAASTVVFLMNPWSLVDRLQAEDRAHRIGSEIHESIEIIDILASSTIDTRVRSVLKAKGGQLSDLLQDKRIVAELLGGASVTRMKSRNFVATITDKGVAK